MYNYELFNLGDIKHYDDVKREVSALPYVKHVDSIVYGEKSHELFVRMSIRQFDDGYLDTCAQITMIINNANL